MTHNDKRANTPSIAGMRVKIGVMGGATGNINKFHLEKAHLLGKTIAKNGCVLVTGACPGLPLASACGAKQEDGIVVGISPALSLDEHVNKYHSPTEFHDILIYTGSGLMGREVVNIRSSDIVVIIGGRSGTLGELAIAYDEGKLIGILTGTGGISNIARDILAACKKETGAHVVYSKEPGNLIKRLINVYQKEHFKKPSHFNGKSALGVMHHPKPGMKRDPVCGMWIVKKTAAAEKKYKNKTYFFCSRGCAQKFEADPSCYVSRR